MSRSSVLVGNFACAVVAYRCAEEFVYAVTIAGDEAIDLITHPIHSGQMQNQPGWVSQWQIAHQTAHCVKAADKVSFRRDHMNLSHCRLKIERRIEQVNLIPVVDVQKLNAMQPIERHYSAAGLIAEETVTVKDCGCHE